MVLRRLREADREQYIAAVRDSREQLDRWMPLHEPRESDDALFDRQLRLAEEGDEAGTAWRRIAVLEGGRIAGGFNVNRISRGLTHEGDANWWVAAPLAGRGLATEAVQAMADHALADLPGGLGLHRLTCGIRPGHAASARVARRVGFLRQEHVQEHLRLAADWVRHEVWVLTLSLRTP